MTQLDVPVGKIDKVPPAFMLWRRKGNVHKRTPLRSFRFADQAHARFTRKPIALARIAGDTRANHVFPSRRSSPIARDDVIQIKVASIKDVAAVLAGALVPLEDRVTRELHVPSRES